MADDGPLQLSLFDQQDLAEITSPDYPGEPLVACATRCWPLTAPDREELLAATEKLLNPVHPGPGRETHRRRADRRLKLVW